VEETIEGEEISAEEETKRHEGGHPLEGEAKETQTAIGTIGNLKNTETL